MEVGANTLLCNTNCWAKDNGMTHAALQTLGARLVSGPSRLAGLVTDVTLTKLGESWMPALESTMEERGSCWKSVDTTSSAVYLDHHNTVPVDI